jgi:hypothetical protein
VNAVYIKDGEEEHSKKQKEFVTLDRKSPPFPPKAGEGWGTLKYAAE